MLEPTFDEVTGALTLPNKPGVTYLVNGIPARGTLLLSQETTVEATVKAPARFREGTTTQWDYSPSGQTPAEPQTPENLSQDD